MSDPLSIAASVGGLAVIALNVVKGIKEIIEDVKTAKPQLQSLLQSVTVLHGLLKGLSLVMDPAKEAGLDDKGPSEAIILCSATLDNIKQLLKKFGSNVDTPTANPGTFSANMTDPSNLRLGRK
ncbi:uncharacterized protein K452DRAFT_302660 [Aplosporella prunicola CBS 121167]|uniref:Azaphilone pigments biosynthesis cluster protein L N-terminal domain-containing protein n=1 Tax=Aplosporella prunicola CBS 121167 TaxID=1176127 RepID=A0A6A6B038_9PEZI|nr:uncharacterized protein K452DRAFT_302660 [Aplosporella prunicola CBS 121167]KAF2136585.1 hypothetical protein K452DRAFT_302660 [Aplosporella prunicola CBS 121167]